MDSINTNLRRKRRSTRISVVDVARFLKITPQTVRWQERHGIQKKSTALRYARFFGCSWQDLID